MTGYDEGWTGSDDLVGFLVAVAFVEPLFPFFTRMLAEITPRVEDLAGVGLAHTSIRHLALARWSAAAIRGPSRKDLTQSFGLPQLRALHRSSRRIAESDGSDRLGLFRETQLVLSALSVWLDLTDRRIVRDS